MATRTRKTRDEWQLWINYGQGWEHEISEESFREARERRKEYSENCPEYPTRIKLARVKLESASTNPKE
jgi:hypothetical protein